MVMIENTYIKNTEEFIDNVKVYKGHFAHRQEKWKQGNKELFILHDLYFVQRAGAVEYYDCTSAVE